MEKTVCVILSILLFLVGCTGGEMAKQNVCGRYYFTGDNPMLHRGHSLIGLMPKCNVSECESFSGHVTLLGHNEKLRCGIEELVSVIPSVHMVMAGDIFMCDDMREQCYLIEIIHDISDTLSIELSFSYLIRTDTAVELVEGSLSLPFIRDSRRFHHRVVIENDSLFPLREVNAGDGEVQRLFIDVDRLLL